jgi:hypothetical protein
MNDRVRRTVAVGVALLDARNAQIGARERSERRG